MEGYPKLAHLQAIHPEVCIYRRFSYLNARNALYLQAELIDLEDMLEHYTRVDIEAGRTDEKKRAYARIWYNLSSSGEEDLNGDENGGLQWHKMLEVRAKLKEYNDCLIQQRQIATFASPAARNIGFLQRWLDRSDGGDMTLEGLDRKAWDQRADLLTTHQDAFDDIFSRWMCGPVLQWYHRCFRFLVKAPSEDVEKGFTYYDDRKLYAVADGIGTIISTMLPLLAILALSFIRRKAVQVSVVAGFTVLFSLALMAFTRSRRVEIFMACAAFASVQVVFISGVN